MAGIKIGMAPVGKGGKEVKQSPNEEPESNNSSR
jgi:hypothetical protein